MGKRVAVILGTRPDAIKMSPVVRALLACRPALETSVWATAQHRSMLDDVLDVFGIHPDHDLDVMLTDQTPMAVTARILERLTPLLQEERPDAVLVQGDTTTAMSAALAAFYERIAVGHVEAGLRTNDRYSPFPEEMMRRLITRLASFHFAPTTLAAEMLEAEGVRSSEIFVTGNPVVDAIDWVVSRTAPAPMTMGRRLVLVTAHRRENFGAPLERICRAIVDLIARNTDIEVVYPVHPNPSVTETVRGMLGGRERISLVPPLRYDEFVRLMARAYIVLSDSGGVQEEGPVLGKPVLVLRENTERPEGVAANATKIVGTDPGRIVAESERLLNDPEAYRRMSQARRIYGDGRSGQRIAEVLSQLIGGVGDAADRLRRAQ